MADLDMVAIAAATKQQYTQRKFYELGYPKNPAWAMIKKSTDMVGDNKVVALRYATTQGRGHKFSAAQANKQPSAYARFTVTTTSDYSTANITGETIAKANGNAGALIKALSKEIDSATLACTRAIATELFHNGGGARGQATFSGTQATLLNIGDATNFERGMTIVTSTADGTSGAVKAGSVQLVNVDRDAGILTANQAWSTGIPTVANSDYLFQDGDFGQGLKGFAAWVPTTKPTAGDNFFGLDRSQDTYRLAGLRVTGLGGPIEETLIQAAALLVREGSRPDTVFMNPLDLANLVKALGAKVIYDRVSAIDMPEVGFQSVKVIGPGGGIDVVAELNCPKGYAYMLQMDTWSFESAGEAPGILAADGVSPILRVSNADSYEVRIGYYGQVICEAPNYNCVITL